MPGLTLLHRTADRRAESPAPQGGLGISPFSSRYRNHKALTGPGIECTVSAYPGYPWLLHETPSYRMVLEGCIYGLSGMQTNRNLEQIAGLVFSVPAVAVRQSVLEWVQETDGDYLLLIQDRRSGEIVLLNDLYGRLPVYYGTVAGWFFCTREYGFAVRMAHDQGYSVETLTQYLVFGYTLGNRTLHRGVHRLSPATMVRLRAGDESPDIQPLREQDYSYGVVGDSPEDTRGVGRALADRFASACRRRAETSEGRHLVLGLSGGLDSRAVAAGLEQAGASFCAASFLKAGRRNRQDLDGAGEVARALNIDWRSFLLPEPSAAHYQRLLVAKVGLNGFENSFMAPFLEEIVENYGADAWYLTGDGGDKALHDLRPPCRLRNAAAFERFVVARHFVILPTAACSLTGMDADSFRRCLREYLEQLPGADWAGKYVNFLFRGRVYKWLFEGEDRNRYYLWSSTPFYAPQFMEYAMRCSFAAKSNFSLYREFLACLSGRAADLGYADYRGASLASWRFALQNHLKSLVLGSAGLQTFRTVKRFFAREASAEGMRFVRARIREQMSTSQSLRENIDEKAIRTFLSRNQKANRGILNLLSLTAALEYSEKGTTCLGADPDAVGL